MSWFLGVQVRLLLGTISLLRAKFGQLLSVLITLGQVSITLITQGSVSWFWLILGTSLLLVTKVLVFCYFEVCFDK